MEYEQDVEIRPVEEWAANIVVSTCHFWENTIILYQLDPDL